LSEAPQADPHAAGFSSGLSEAPQADPQAAAGASSIFLFHPNRLESAIVFTSKYVFRVLFALCIYHCTIFFHSHKYALFYWDTHLFVTIAFFRAFRPIQAYKLF
jgi:hypothetical protein